MWSLALGPGDSLRPEDADRHPPERALSPILRMNRICPSRLPLQPRNRDEGLTDFSLRLRRRGGALEMRALFDCPRTDSIACEISILDHKTPASCIPQNVLKTILCLLNTGEGVLFRTSGFIPSVRHPDWRQGIPKTLRSTECS